MNTLSYDTLYHISAYSSDFYNLSTLNKYFNITLDYLYKNYRFDLDLGDKIMPCIFKYKKITDLTLLLDIRIKSDTFYMDKKILKLIKKLDTKHTRSICFNIAEKRANCAGHINLAKALAYILHKVKPRSLQFCGYGTEYFTSVNLFEYIPHCPSIEQLLLRWKFQSDSALRCALERMPNLKVLQIILNAYSNTDVRTNDLSRIFTSPSNLRALNMITAADTERDPKITEINWGVTFPQLQSFYFTGHNENIEHILRTHKTAITVLDINTQSIPVIRELIKRSKPPFRIVSADYFEYLYKTYRSIRKNYPKSNPITDRRKISDRSGHSEDTILRAVCSAIIKKHYKLTRETENSLMAE